MTNQSIVPQKNIDVGTIHPASEDPTAPTKATLSLGHLSPAVGREYACTILAAGELEGHGKFLPAAVLEKAAHLFTNLTAFVDHPSWLERQKIDRMAGVFKDAHYSDDRIKATLALWPTPAADWLATLLDHLIQAQDDDEPAANIGISAELWWQVDWDHVRSDGLYNITQIVDVEAAVVTFNPGSDAARFEKILAQAGILPPHITQEVKEMSDKLTKPPEVTAAGPPPQPQTFDPAPHMRALTEAVLTAQLAASPLPQAMKETVRLQFTGQVANPDEISAAIGRQTALLAKLQEDSVISGFGTPRQGGSFIHGMANDLDRLQAAVDAMVAGVRPKDARPLTGVRELYHILSGDYAMTGVFQGEHVQLANANTSTMAGMVANAMNKVIVNLWQQYPKFWEKAVTVRDFSNLNDARWITLGGIGELPTVAEGGTYGELSWDDLTETDAFVKKGGYLGLTMEAIDKDDTSKLMAAPQALTQAAWLTLGKAVSAIFTTASGTGPTMSDSVVLFHAVTHGNLLTTALSPAEIEVVDIAMKKQTELNSGERLGALTRLHYLWVPIDLTQKAIQYLASANVAEITDNTINPYSEGDLRSQRLQWARDRVIEVPFWTDTDNWAAQANPLLYPSIGLGFRFGRLPEVFDVTDPKAGLMFSNDVMPIKVRFVFAVGPTDWRGLHKSNL